MPKAKNMQQLFRHIFVLQFVLCCGTASFSQDLPETTSTLNFIPEGTTNDSLLLDFSLKDLVELRSHYEQETERLIAVQDSLRIVGIRDMENFVAMYPNSPVLAEVMLRLADLQYEQADKDFVKALTAYNHLAEQYETGNLALEPEEPFPDYSRSLELYQRIIDEFPRSELVDDAIYNKGFLLEDAGERDKAVAVYQQLVESYPESRFAPDALMRIAESYFRPPFDRIDAAIASYKKVLQYKASPLYDAALYRLGWAYYKLNDFASAIAYFTVLADDIDRVRPLDPETRHHFPAVRDEAIEYLGISFVDFGGAEDAADFFDKIGGRGYGIQVFRKIGDAYMDVKEEYEDAALAYRFLLAMYPDIPDAPFIEAKIVQAYKKHNDERMAYVTRAELFDKFGSREGRSGGAHREVRNLTESSLRENINYLFKQAQENPNAHLYEQAVSDSRSYLRAYPTDSSAVVIHWNIALTLDTKLRRRQEAFEEYIKISNLYQNQQYRKQAAENAIATADELVKLDHRDDPGNTTGTASEMGLTLVDSDAASGWQALTENEKRLALSLNNYIRNFPHAPETSKVLARAGELYYNKRQFKESLKYFKTLAKHFPDSPGINYARYITMESYFGKGDYRSAEVMARNIRARSPDYRDQANLRLGEAIFLQASTLADSAHHTDAAEQYMRVLTEAPTVPFADLALFNTALEYEAARAYEKAIDTYTQFLDIFQGSQYTLKALNNLAFDFHELGDFLKAGETYEALANEDVNDSTAQVALFNASVSFVRAQAWERAIDANNVFSQRYPDSPDADRLLFDNAGYYLKLNDIGSANAIYDRFTANYPNSPLTIEAYYHRGNYYMRTKRLEEARQQFEAALRKGDQFKAEGLAINDFIVSEAMFQLAELEFLEYEAVKFDTTHPALAARLENKKRLLADLVRRYTEVIGSGTYHAPEATFKIGRAYEEFAETWAGQEIVERDESKRVVARTEINKTANELFDRAIASFKSGAEALRKLLTTHVATGGARTDTLAALSKLAVEDSTVQLTRRWLLACQEKVSEDLFKAASLYDLSLQEVLDLPVPGGMSKLEELIYRKEVLKKIAAPLAEQVVAGHRRNVEQSADMNLKNQWVTKSQQRIFAARNLVPTITYELGVEGAGVYAGMVRDYERLVKADDDSALDLAEQMSALAEFSGTQALKAAQGLTATLETVGAGEADSVLIADNEEDLFRRVYEYAVQSDSLALSADQKRAQYEQRFKETDSINYEDAYFTFDDLYFKLNEAANNLLRFGSEVSTNWANAGIWSRKIGMALVRRAPAEYADKYGLVIETQTFASDSDWLATSEQSAGWYEREFADTLWSNAYTEGAATHLNTADAKALWLMNFNPSVLTSFDSTALGGEVSFSEETTETEFARAVVRPDTVYFRKTFDISGLPVAGKIQFYLDGACTLYVNGEPVPVAGPDSTAAEPVRVSDVTRQLLSGKNVIAIRAENVNRSQASLEARVEVQSISDWTSMQDGWQEESEPGLDESKQSTEIVTE